MPALETYQNITRALRFMGSATWPVSERVTVIAIEIHHMQESPPIASSTTCDRYICYSSLFVILVHMVLRLPTHKVAREWEQQRVHCAPSNQDSKVKTNS